MGDKKQILVEGPISADFISKSISDHHSKTNIGGHSIFLGQVRADEINGKKVKEIEYSAYEVMVAKQVQKIKDKIFSKYNDLQCMHIKHSIGIVKTGEISLFVFVSCGHRKESFKACEETVELIKQKLPVWKKEVFEDDSYNWKE